MLSDELFVKSGGNFPYRRYINGTSNNIKSLITLVRNYVPEYEYNMFDQKKLEDKVKSKMKGSNTIFDMFEKGPRNMKKQGNWELDSVIDQYTETARMSSPGYGKNHTPLDLWYKTSNSKLRERILQGKKTLLAAREAIYEEGEVRLAYVTDSIGLYNHIKNEFLFDANAPTVIDITAFGDRLTAAAATGFEYMGVDPDPNLVDGISRLMVDLKTIVPDFVATTYTLPLEHFSPPRQVDLVTFSPPPYDAEPYTGGDRQVHKVYRNKNHWFYGFIREALVRASSWLVEGGILAFSVLDRPTAPVITYTEPMILLAMNLGFRPLQIFTLSGGMTPWWIFVKDNSFSSDLFMKLYPELIIDKINSNTSPQIEYIRMLASSYITETCINHNIFYVPPEKELKGSEDLKGSKKMSHISNIMTRILMSKIPHPDSADPLFPDLESDVIINDNDINNIKDIDLPIVIQTADAGYRSAIVYSDGKCTKDILMEIFNAVNGYLHWIQTTNEFEIFSSVVKPVSFNNKGFSSVSLSFPPQSIGSAIGFIRKRTLFTAKSLESIKISYNNYSLWSTTSKGATIDNINSYIRYTAAGESAHHLTRPSSRIEAIAKILKTSKNEIVDLFATPFNANSKLYCSVYPDVDPGSLGNFFTYEGGVHKYFMSNPPPFDGFKEVMIERLTKVYLEEQGKIIFHSTTVWDDGPGKTYIDRIKNGEDPEFEDKPEYEEKDTYYDLSYIWEHYKDRVKAVYILDHTLHPTFDMSQGKTVHSHRPTASVGVILTTSDIRINCDDLKLLSSGNHVIFSLD